VALSKHNCRSILFIGPESPNLAKVKFYTLTSAPQAGPPEANHAKGQNATKPAEPKKKHPQKPKSSPEHPFSRTNVPTQRIQPGTPPLPRVLCLPLSSNPFIFI
jgi:hypothetical protein